MSDLFNIYCDESCHLENDGKKFMALGAVWLPNNKKKDVMNDLIEIKEKYNLSSHYEIKWQKVSPSKLDFYKEVILYFFENDDLHYRGLVANKEELDHESYNQTHDEWYYKMYYNLLSKLLSFIFSPRDKHRIYLDIKDTQGNQKIKELRKIISHFMYDFDMELIEHFQVVRSHEVSILQIADLLTGAICALHREETTSDSKNELITLIQEKSGYKKRSTLPREDKMNIFIWHSQTNDSTIA
ncbi:MAG: DUF3800 domain-containing protein [Candidatus Peribacteraceae bacterium]|nr:DUF3800 domain-containing protein [Candidatus Peribacteraceae bacterium]